MAAQSKNSMPEPVPDPLVSVVIINWNGERLLPACLTSLKKQTYTNLETILIDNASRDRSLEIVEEQMPEVQVIRNSENCGFSKAANQGIERSLGEYALLLNIDVELDPDYILELVKDACTHPEAGSFGGKLLRSDSRDHDIEIIDSTGLILLKNKRRPWDRGAGQPDQGQYAEAENVLGVNAAAALYRKSMLEAIAQNGQIFDEDFFIYFEDVDLALRACLQGWESRYVPTAFAYHLREGTEGVRQGEIRACSSRNRYLVYLKNEPWQVFLSGLIQILWIESLRVLSYAVKDPWALLGFFKFLYSFPRMLKKRKRIQSQAKISAREFQRWYE